MNGWTTYIWKVHINMWQHIQEYSLTSVNERLGSRTIRFTNKFFRTQSVSDDVLCLELRTPKPSASWSDKLGVSASAVFVGVLR